MRGFGPIFRGEEFDFRLFLAQFCKFPVYSKYLKNRAVWLVLFLASTAVAMAQSSRPGWGATPYSSGTTFRVWAPNATSVYVAGQFNSWNTSANPLVKELTNSTWTGVWSVDVAGATAGLQYKYYINSTNGNAYKNDPRARWLTGPGTASGSNSIIYNPTNFNWNGDTRTPPAMQDLFVYELHIGTFYPSASTNKFISATNRLDYLKSLGVNAVEVMPIAEFGNGGTSWGYDPAQPFAVDNAAYGGPDGFKIFVQACHLRGLAVLLDVVHNHYGPNEMDMWNFDGYAGGGLGGGIYFNQANTNAQKTSYGNTRPNFAQLQVSNYVVDNFTMWLSEYHVDGFRWDTPNLMMNADNYGYIPAAGNLITAINQSMHSNYPGSIGIAEDTYKAKGFDSAWDTDYPFYIRPVLTSSTDANRDMTLLQNSVPFAVRYGGTADTNRVVFLESHDVVGDLNSGVRTVTAIDSTTPNSYKARKLSTLGAAVTLTAPGVPMIFQGEEMLENQSFSSGRSVDWTKTNTYSYIVQFYRDLIGARRDLKGYTPGLEGDKCNMFAVDNASKLVAFQRWKSSAPNQSAVVIANFSGTILSNYSLNFPSAGNWYTHLNSDSTSYGPDYGGGGSSVVTASGNPATGNVTIGPYSALIMSQTPDAPPQLTIVPAGGGVTISWPAGYFEWVLSTSPAPGTQWAQIPTSQYQTNGGTVYINVTSSGTTSFYRLGKP